MSGPTSEAKKLEKRRLVEQQLQSGLSAKKWCLQNQIHPNTFHSWKRKLFPTQLQKSSFTELTCKRSHTTLLQMRGLCIRMNDACDPSLRKQLFALFAEASC